MGVIEDLFDRGFRGGDSAAQWEFVDRVTPLLLGYIQGGLRVRGADVEEIAAEAIARTVGRAGGIDVSVSLLPYMYKVARNLKIDRQRRSAVRGGGTLPGGEGLPPKEPHERAAPVREPWKRLHAAEVLAEFLACARARLDGTLLRTFGALVLHHWDNRLTAEALRVTRNAVAVRKTRIRVDARSCFERYEGMI